MFYFDQQTALQFHNLLTLNLNKSVFKRPVIHLSFSFYQKNIVKLILKLLKNIALKETEFPWTHKWHFFLCLSSIMFC